MERSFSLTLLYTTCLYVASRIGRLGIDYLSVSFTLLLKVVPDVVVFLLQCFFEQLGIWMMLTLLLKIVPSQLLF